MAGIYLSNPTFNLRRIYRLQYSPSSKKRSQVEAKANPQFLKLAVSGASKALLLYNKWQVRVTYEEKDEGKDEISVSSVDDVLMKLKGFLLPIFMIMIVSLKTLPLDFKGVDSETTFILAKWKLRTYLRLPWRLLIMIDGSTIYELTDKLRIVRHAESWNVSALEAIGQIFTPSFGRPGD